MGTQDEAKVEAGPKPPVNHAEYAAYTPQVELIEAAVANSDAEALLPRKELFDRYWPAVVYSMLLSLALVMEGMDVGLINNFFAHPAYLKRFGWPDANGEQHISTQWQGAIGAGNNIGSVFGLLLNGYLQSRYGSRKVYMVCLAPDLHDTTRATANMLI
jgi:SP family general alpha glucoside:H+ symporter-like MFS transporter